MKQQEWYAGRRRIVAAQQALRPIFDHLEKLFAQQVYDDDPVTNRSPITVITRDHFREEGTAFEVQSITGGSVKLSIAPHSAVIQVVPPIDVGEVTGVSAVIGSTVDPGTSLTLLFVATTSGENDERQVSLHSLFEAIEEAVLVEEPSSRSSR